MVTRFSLDMELGAPPTPKFLRSDFCLYIFEGLFLKKEKYDGLILLKLKTKRHVFKRQCF